MTALHKFTFRSGPLFALAVALPLAIPAVGGQAKAGEETEQGNPLTDKGSWNDLRADIVGDKDPAGADGIVDLAAPYRAHDAATVPISIKQPGPTAPAIDSAKLVIDENPAPVAAEMTFGPAMHPLDLELRVRVNQYSNVRLIAHTADGPVMTGRSSPTETVASLLWVVTMVGAERTLILEFFLAASRMNPMAE